MIVPQWYQPSAYIMLHLCRAFSTLALWLLQELGINITRVNPAHLAQEHQEEFIECSCAEDQREYMISKLKSYGAKNAEEGVYNYIIIIKFFLS
jgi:hypothetical protein